jgi:uncharacterized protein (TIGR00661 family)
VAPLDWGLGHATRCIPLIRVLLSQNCDVLIAAEGRVKILLEQEFPTLIFLPLRGYRIRYSRKKNGMPLKMLIQLPGLIYRVYSENRWLKKMIPSYSIGLVISDNRFGLHTNAAPCVYITHQLTIKTGNRFTESIAKKLHYHFINKYNFCWVPDTKGKNNLAGELSHSPILPKTSVTYIGPLSRFENIVTEKKYDLAVILSGPEPQRSAFENILLKDLEKYEGSCIFVRGLPGDVQVCKSVNEKIEFHNHLSSIALNNVIQQSALVICRSGYTTVMDMIRLQKKAILIPTPGQTEQEYLAGYLMTKKIFYSTVQKGFSLDDALIKAAAFSFEKPVIDLEEYKMIITNFIAGPG